MPKLHVSDLFSEWRLRRRPLSFSTSLPECHMLASLASERMGKSIDSYWKLAADGNTIRGAETDVAKGQNLTHVGFHRGNRETHTEKLLSLSETRGEHMTLLLFTAGMCSWDTLLTTDCKRGFFIIFFNMYFSAASHVKLSKNLPPLPTSPLPNNHSDRVTAVRRKTDPEWNFQLNCQKLAVLLNSFQ